LEADLIGSIGFASREEDHGGSSGADPIGQSKKKGLDRLIAGT
jgi:hypothetical protein